MGARSMHTGSYRSRRRTGCICPCCGGHSLKAVGRGQEAVESYRAAAARRPDFGDAYWSLANLKTYRFDPQEIERMQAVEAAPGTQFVDRYHLCFALGKAFEDRVITRPLGAITSAATLLNQVTTNTYIGYVK